MLAPRSGALPVSRPHTGFAAIPADRAAMRSGPILTSKPGRSIAPKVHRTSRTRRQVLHGALVGVDTLDAPEVGEGDEVAFGAVDER